MFDYAGSFQSAITALKRERRYRVFADLEQVGTVAKELDFDAQP